MKYTVKEVNGKYNAKRIYDNYDAAAQAAWLDNMSNNRATYAVYEVINLNGREALRKVHNH